MGDVMAVLGTAPSRILTCIELGGFTMYSMQLRFRQVDLVGLGYALKCRLSSADSESLLVVYQGVVEAMPAYSLYLSRYSAIAIYKHGAVRKLGNKI